MSEIAQRPITRDKPYKRAVLITVVIGIVLNVIDIFMTDGRSVTFKAALLGGGMSLLFLFFSVYDALIFDRLPLKWAASIFFFVQSLLILGIGWFLGNSGTWLMALPLVGWAVENLTAVWRWLVYAAMTLALILPTALLYDGWTVAIANSFNLAAAMFFVVVFVQMQLKEQAGREYAEELSTKLEGSNRQLTEYAAQVKELATTQERHRLARELHDSVTQSLYSLTLLAAGWRRMAVKGQLDSVEDSFAEIEDVAQQALKEMRLLIYELRPPALEKEGLQGALHHRLSAVEKRAGVEVQLVTAEVLELPPHVEEALYAIAVEALNNTLKHAAATRVTVRLLAEGGCVKMEVMDNGRGFDPTHVEDGLGMGLKSIQERVENMHGKLEITSVPGEGVCVQVEVKL